MVNPGAIRVAHIVKSVKTHMQLYSKATFRDLQSRYLRKISFYNTLFGYIEQLKELNWYQYSQNSNICHFIDGKQNNDDFMWF